LRSVLELEVATRTKGDFKELVSVTAANKKPPCGESTTAIASVD
jgi:hypothetical protein